MDLGLQAGYAWGTDSEAQVHGGVGVRLHLQLGGVVRAGLDLGRVRPALVGGLAWYRANKSGIGFSGGGEVELHFIDWLPLVVDARFHVPFDATPNNYSRTLGLGTRLFW